MGAIIAILLFVGGIFLVGKINKGIYRAKQTVLNKVGVGDSNINSMTDDILEKRKLEKFLENHPTYTEESIKKIIEEFVNEIVNQNITHKVDSKILEKNSTDSRMEKFRSMQIKRCSLSAYNENAGLFIGKVTLSNGKDEFMMFLTFQLSGDDLILTKYQIQKGAVVGF